MSILNKFFGTNKEETPSEISWRKLIDLGQLQEIETLSFEKPVLIFKHSTRCSISRFALKNFEREYDFTESALIPYFLDLLEYRMVSSEIANRFKVIHQSPQILIIKEGQCIYTTSHDAIDALLLKEVISN